jgi:hypothetical protein
MYVSGLFFPVTSAYPEWDPSLPTWSDAAKPFAVLRPDGQRESLDTDVQIP